MLLLANIIYVLSCDWFSGNISAFAANSGVRYSVCTKVGRENKKHHGILQKTDNINIFQLSYDKVNW